MATVQSITNSSATGLDISQASSMTNNQITAALMNGNIDSKFASVLLNQMTANNVNSILLGDQDNTGASSKFDPFAGQSITDNVDSTDMFGSAASSSFVTPQFEMSVYSSLIGKKVTATDPSSGKQITDTVASVSVENGKAVLQVGKYSIPPENLIKIQK